MNVLITGATGFIGKHLTAALSKTYSVRCLVRKTSDIKELRDLNVDLVYGDLLDKNSLAPALDKIDLVYHLAGEVYSRKKEDYYRGNVLATQNLLETCNEKGTKKIIFLSSVGVYKPATTKTLLTEESECEPITYYGKTKLDAEALIKKYGIPWVIVRAPVIYGPHQKSVLNRFFLDAINKRRVLIFGSGDNLRSLCFIDNLVEGLVLLANNPDVHEKMYILSDSSSYTYNEMIPPVSKALQQQLKLVRLPSFLGSISWGINSLIGSVFGLSFVELYAIKKTQFHEAYDISKARNEIGYYPSVTLEEGMKNTIDWVRKTFASGEI
jgi:nucleoside-diphosphate-sugar epimerase